MSENSKNKEIKTSGLRPPSKIPSVGVSRIPSSSSIKLGKLIIFLLSLNIIVFCWYIEDAYIENVYYFESQFYVRIQCTIAKVEISVLFLKYR